MHTFACLRLADDQLVAGQCRNGQPYLLEVKAVTVTGCYTTFSEKLDRDLYAQERGPAKGKQAGMGPSHKSLFWQVRSWFMKVDGLHEVLSSTR